MAIDKSLRQHYEMQGKVKNYLGKQKMVKAPKYWKSGPDHPDTELAYITKAEKDLILKADLHSSLSKGPNIGPSGLMSLNSAGSGYGGPGPGSGGGQQGGGGGGGGGGQDIMPVSVYKAPAAPKPTIDIGFQEALRKGPKEAPPGEKGRAGYVSPEDLRKQGIKDLISKQQEEKYGVGADPTKFGETVEGPDLRTEREKEEDFERAQDWDKIQKLSDKGYSSEEIQNAMEKGLLTKTDPKSIQKSGLRSLRNIIPETGLEKSLLGRLKSSFTDMGTKKGLAGQAKSFAKRQAMQFIAQKLGLGALFNPAMLLFSLFGGAKRFAKKPAFDMEAASELGLHANRFATTGGQLPTNEEYAKDLTTPKDTPSMQIAGGKGLESGAELLGLKKDKEMYFAGKESPMPEDLDAEINQLESFIEKNPEFTHQYHKVYLTDLKAARHNKLLREDPNRPGLRLGQSWEFDNKAHGGRIDKPLMGRSRYL